MAYPHYMITVPLLTSGGDTLVSGGVVGDKVYYLAGPQQVVVRRVAIQPSTTGAWATGVRVSFRKVCGKYASATGGQFAVVTMPCGKALREDGLIFNDSFTPTKIPAGYGICANVTRITTTKYLRAFAVIEPSPERLQNFSTGYFLSVTG